MSTYDCDARAAIYSHVFGWEVRLLVGPAPRGGADTGLSYAGRSLQHGRGVESGDVGEGLAMKALAMKRFYVTVALDPKAPIKQFEQYLLAVIGYLGAERATVVLDTRDGMVAVSWASVYGNTNLTRVILEGWGYDVLEAGVLEADQRHLTRRRLK